MGHIVRLRYDSVDAKGLQSTIKISANNSAMEIGINEASLNGAGLHEDVNTDFDYLQA